ncbi:MAG: DNA repair exonuclease [Lautropia sp.]|nr:DNA repair exonuclease [Lautropia sp.]
MPRFLHTADWQIGRTYQRFAPDDAAFLAEARLATVERIARLAAQRRVDAVLVAGDVFDAQTVSDRTVRRLFNALAAFGGRWLMIPGNHDAALAAGVWTRARQLGCMPGNVHLLERPCLTSFEDLGFVVLAAPLTQRQTHSDLTAWFDDVTSPAELVRVGLAHGSVGGILPGTVDSPNPIAPDRASTARLDYLALGDWHGTRRVDGRTWYSGTPEQDRFKDNDPGNVLQVEIAGPSVEPVVEAIPVGTFRWHEWERRIGIPTDVDELERDLASLAAGDVAVVRIDGKVDLNQQLRIRRLLGIAQGRVRALEADLSQLRLSPTEADIAALAADGYVGEVLAALRNAAPRQYEQQVPPAAVEEEAVAAQALNILAGLLLERQQ